MTIDDPLRSGLSAGTSVDVASLRSLLAPFDPDTLQLDASSTCACTPDGRIFFVNRAWTAFGLANGAHDDDPRLGIGMRLLDVAPAKLRPFYERFFSLALASDEPMEWEYNCSSPAMIREFRMRVIRCASGALLISHALVRETAPGLDARAATEALYRNGHGIIVQCAHCRRVRRAGAQSQWDWVGAFVAHMPVATSHGLCPVCDAYYYPR